MLTGTTFSFMATIGIMILVFMALYLLVIFGAMVVAVVAAPPRFSLFLLRASSMRMRRIAIPAAAKKCRRFSNSQFPLPMRRR